MKSTTQRALILFVLAIALVAAGLYWWKTSRTVVAPPVASEPSSAEPPPILATQPEPKPMEMPVPDQALTTADIKPALSDLLGLQAVQTFFQLNEFPRKFVATVDNLGRASAPPLAWPVIPSAGRFTVKEGAGTFTISEENASRYTPLVALAEAARPAAVIDLYVRMYPMLQKSYEELGYPNRQFNDRLLQVIDQLLATPAASANMQVSLTEIKGPMATSLRPWVRYEFADPALESLSSGQKILLRMGPENERRIKAWLSGLRAEIRSRAKPQ